MTTPLLHLGLLVRDQRRSPRLYATYFGFDEARARRYPDGTVIVGNPQGFDLALHPGDPPERLPAFVAFRVPTPRRRRRAGAVGQDGAPMACRSWSAGTSRAMWPSSAWTLTAGGWRPTGNRSARPAAWDERRA